MISFRGKSELKSKKTRAAVVDDVVSLNWSTQEKAIVIGRFGALRVRPYPGTVCDQAEACAKVMRTHNLRPLFFSASSSFPFCTVNFWKFQASQRSTLQTFGINQDDLDLKVDDCPSDPRSRG